MSERMQEYLDSLNEAQQKPVYDTEGAVLVLAGAGSGKTRVLTSRIAYLVEHKLVRPWNILAITFTNKAANEMRERLAEMTDIDGMWVTTIHSMCTRILRENRNIERLGYTRDFTIYAEDEKKRIVKRLLEERNFDDEKVLKSALWNISDAKCRHISPEQFSVQRFDVPNVDLIAEVYAAYNLKLKGLNSLDFDDILTKTFDLFNEFPDVLQHYQERFHYVHIDEFQDTNEIQFIIIKALSMGHGNLFAVGDDDQSIYGWRGADIRNVIDFKETFPQAKIYKLEQNYRCSKKILDAANRVIHNNRTRMDKTLWTDNGDGVKIEMFQGFDEKEEAYYVASQINSLVTHSGYQLSDFGVLMRVNALTHNFEQEFLKYNIAYRVFGGFKFYERKEIKDILAYLRLLVNPYDEDAVRRVINVPKRGIGDSSVNALAAYASGAGMPLLNAVMEIETNTALPGAAVKKIAKFKDVVLALSDSMENMELAEFIDAVLRHTGILDMYAEDSEENLNKRLNIEEFASSVKQFAEDNDDATLSDFIQSVTLSADIDSAEDGDNTVTLATVHSVKGLEFKVVFIVGLDDGIFPLSRSKNSPEELEEERRLMYVAITRARERLYLTRAESRYLYGRRDYMLKSQFLEESGMIPESKKLERFLNGEDGAPRKSLYEPSPAAFLQRAQQSRATSVDLSRFQVGARVVHKSFGEGAIIGVTGSGTGMTVTVVFKGIGVKTLAAAIAPVTFIEE